MSLGSFVEELGECSFGILASRSSGEPASEQFETVKESWKLLRPYFDISRGLGAMANVLPDRDSPIAVDDDSLVLATFCGLSTGSPRRSFGLTIAGSTRTRTFLPSLWRFGPHEIFHLLSGELRPLSLLLWAGLRKSALAPDF